MKNIPGPSPHELTEQPMHRYRIPRLSLIHVRQCLGDVLPSGKQQHRVPTEGERIVINGDRKELNDVAWRVADMYTLDADTAVGVAVYTERPFEGFTVYANNLRGSRSGIPTPRSVGFVALVGNDGRSFGVSTLPEAHPNKPHVIEEIGLALAIVKHGLEKAFRCTD